MDIGEFQPLYHEIRDYYEGMNMILDQQIPMLLVERQALNEAMEGEKDVSITIVLLLLFFISFIMPQGSNMCLVRTCSILFAGTPSYARDSRTVPFRRTDSQQCKSLLLCFTQYLIQCYAW